MGWTRRQRCIAIVSGVWLFGALFVLGGGVAFADVVPDVTQPVDDAVDGVTQAVDDPVDGVTQATANTANGAASAAGAAASSATTSVGGESQKGSSESETRRPADREASHPNLGGQTEPGTWVPYGFREPTPAIVPAIVAWSDSIAQRGQGAQTDPCEQDESLVCLGVLYGLGEFADAGTEVLGVLVTTGASVIGLVMLAAGLAVAGAWALVAATTALAGMASRAV